MAEASLDEFDRFYRVNVRGTLHCVQAASKAMKKQEPLVLPGRNGPREAGRGCIINLGSCNSYVATHHIVQYTSSKHAVLGLTRNAGELRFPSDVFCKSRAAFSAAVGFFRLSDSYTTLPLTLNRADIACASVLQLLITRSTGFASTLSALRGSKRL